MIKTAFARTLRRNQTDSERKLWQLLRGRRFLDMKFRRQQQIGPYIVDFYCSRAKLIIELDGSHHLDQMQYDETRTHFLQQEGYTVFRFWDNEILRDSEGVMNKIHTFFQARNNSPHPCPLPGREREIKEGDLVI